MNKKNETISICKGIGIILMVMGHTCCPGMLTAFIYMFHMPLFFIASGYFFSVKYVDDKSTFIKKKVKGLYFPFVKWSLLFLVLHNVFFMVGLQNTSYGNMAGGVVRPYTYSTMLDFGGKILYSMGGYDPFVLGTFWFLRSLFVGSILFCLLYYLIHKFVTKNEIVVGIIICLLAFAAGLKLAWHATTIPYWPQGGSRELYALFYIGAGFIFRRTRLNDHHKYDWILAICAFLFVAAYSQIHPTTLKYRPNLTLYLNTFLPGIIGWIMVYKASHYISCNESRIKNLLVYIGNNTMPIFAFSLLSFKIVNALKIFIYGLDPRMISCYPVIWVRNEWFWVVYTICGVAVPLFVNAWYFRIKGYIIAKRS